MHTGIKEKMFRVGFTQGDINARLTPGNVLRLAQQITLEHCDELGFGAAELLSHNRAFVLAKLKIDVKHMPEEGDQVKLVTTAYAPKRLVYQRVTEIRTPEDEVLVSVDSRWTMIDTTTWRITRDVEQGLVEKLLPVQDFADIRMPIIEFTGEKPEVQVRYSMLDTNKHVNNAFYADWVQDALADELMAGRQVRSMQLLYHREAKLGDVVKMKHACADGVHYLRGEHDKGHCFDAIVELTEAE